MIEQIISGGQTGVDQVALVVAQSLGIKTGGMVPKGCRTDAGPAPWLIERFGMKESFDTGYVVRTVANVRAAHATIWFGNPSPGYSVTYKTAMIERKTRPYGWLENPTADQLRELIDNRMAPIKILNVAGNRLSNNPEATELARKVLTEVLHP